LRYKVRIIGDPILRKKAEDVEVFDKKLRKFVDEMIDIMYVEDGIGLAAPQIGFSNRIIVVDASELIKGEYPRAFINPEIIHFSEETDVKEEGCLSIPGVHEEVTRSVEIVVKYQDEKGRQFTETYTDWLARILQHEIDHLNGVLFVDRISPIKRNLLITQKAIPAQF